MYRPIKSNLSAQVDNLPEVSTMPVQHKPETELSL